MWEAEGEEEYYFLKVTIPVCVLATVLVGDNFKKKSAQSQKKRGENDEFVVSFYKLAPFQERRPGPIANGRDYWAQFFSNSTWFFYEF